MSSRPSESTKTTSTSMLRGQHLKDNLACSSSGKKKRQNASQWRCTRKSINQSTLCSTPGINSSTTSFFCGNNNYKITDIIWIPPLIDRGLLLIKGDILLPIGRELTTFNRLSSLNDFKSTTRLVFDKASDTLAMHFCQKREGIADLTQIINLFYSYPDQAYHEFAEGLRLHAARLLELAAIAERIAQFNQQELIIQLTEQRFQQFYTSTLAKVKALVATSSLSSAFKVNFFKVEFTRGDYRMAICCTSQTLLEVIGLDVESISYYNMRKGIIEFLSHDDSFGISKYFLHLANSLKNENLVDFDTVLVSPKITIKTVDGIDLPASVQWKLVVDRDLMSREIFKTNIQHFAVIQNYEISPNTLANLLEYRQKLPNTNLWMESLENEADWDYSHKTSQFIDKFYQPA